MLSPLEPATNFVERLQDGQIDDMRLTTYVATMLAEYGEQCYNDGISVGVKYATELDAWHHARGGTTRTAKVKDNGEPLPKPHLPEFPYPATYFEE